MTHRRDSASGLKRGVPQVERLEARKLLSVTYTPLVTFDGGNGADPQAGLIADSAGNLFGTTETGGANGLGSIYEIYASNHSSSLLTSFNNASLEYPGSRLVFDTDGNLYGTVESSGNAGFGAVY